MRILFNDIIQNSDAPDELKSPALSETYTTPNGRQFTITFDKEYPINAIGMGNAAPFTCVIINLNETEFPMRYFQYSENGLYVFPKTIITSRISIYTNSRFIGRLGAGLGVHIPTAIAKEPSFKSTSEPRVTLSGQVIPGAGGYNYRTISLDCRYKITQEAVNEIMAGHKMAGMGYPYFIDFSDESYKLPFSKFYANEKNQRDMTLQGGIRRYLYSKRFEFEEQF
jgi:hypothetical protein